MRVPSLALLALFAGALAPGAHAQSTKLPKRPRLGSAADTNDARAYYDRGRELLDRDPRTAADAFYWASRIDPSWPEPLYARRIAGFMADEALLVRYLEGQRAAVQSRQAQALDSLEYRAQMLNPFFLRDLDRTFVAAYLVGSYNRELRRAGQPPLDISQQQELDYYVDVYLRTGPSFRLRAALAASQRRFEEALDLYRRAIEDSYDKPGIYADRARLFFTMGAHDSAVASLGHALDELRERDDKRLVRVYDSKEFFEHALGMIHEHQHDVESARAAYGRALQEHLSYYPAHVRLGLLALAAGDTATAASELALAAEVAPSEGQVHALLGAVLAQTGRAQEAMPHLRRAVELEPYYAMPYYLLGQVGELLRDHAQALEGYQGFLVRAPRRDERRAAVGQRIADLGP
jgi:tetratricopeptide (TPR) repeat protein